MSVTASCSNCIHVNFCRILDKINDVLMPDKGVFNDYDALLAGFSEEMALRCEGYSTAP